ncbi:hypothetical protein BDV36DRAFT_247082 [Aspergillus pseudocaelatus]|uniref:Uncharacterized protein n=1 Tax=Aspergillus pseudocaelatus TaxID=1825620 RepID=A0ABQ6WXT0_9EURO|nr:hypothetical protein BDV36DRAFT_247082 [Aspergillus pseudocaelatus]
MIRFKGVRPRIRYCRAIMGNFPSRNDKGRHALRHFRLIITLAFLLHIYDISSHQTESGTPFLNTTFLSLSLSLALP